MIAWLKKLADQHPVSEAELSASVDGRLPESRRIEVERHVSSCETCRASLAELRSVKAMLSALPGVTASRSFTLAPSQVGRPGVLPRRAAPVWAPALALSVLVLLLAVDVSGSSQGNRDSGNSFATKSVSNAEDSSSGAAPPAPQTQGARAAQTPPASLQPQAAGAAVQPAPTAAGAAESALAPAQPTAVPPSATAVADRQGSGWSTLRVMEVLSALALVGSLLYVWWYRSRPAPARKDEES